MGPRQRRGDRLDDQERNLQRPEGSRSEGENMGMTDSDGTGLTHSAGGRTQQEARRARKDANRHFEKKETARYREAIASLGKEAREARSRRKVKRAEAKQKCTGYVTEAKEKNKDK